MTVYFESDEATVHHGDCLDILATLPDASVDAVVTDPPYGLEFMGRGWDAPWQERDINTDAGFHGGGISATKGLPSFTSSTNPKCLVCKGTRRGRRDGTAKVAVCLCADGGHFPNVRAVEMRAFQLWVEQWAIECLRVLKPGGHMLAFGGSRTWHRLAGGIEDAGFEIRDSIAWLYGTGFAKTSVDEQGRSTSLKPAFEPIVLSRKPIAATVAITLADHGTGALNVDACRIPATDAQLAEKYASVQKAGARSNSVYGVDARDRAGSAPHAGGRYPANVVLGREQAVALDASASELPARFFYTAKASTDERPNVNGVQHPTVKPLDLMRWLVRLVTPRGGVVLEPFAGSGTTVEAAVSEGFRCIAVEREAEYLPLIESRLSKPIGQTIDIFGGAA